MKIAFVFIAEAYQVYHCLAVAEELLKRPDVEVDFYHSDPETPQHITRIAAVSDVALPPSRPLRAGLLGGAIRSVRRLGLAKPQVLAANEDTLAGYDALVSSEDVIARAFSGVPYDDRPKRMLITHGAGGRVVPSFKNRRDCDLLLVKGKADVERHLREGFARPGHIAAGGYTKTALTARLARCDGTLFENDNPIVLYNPHKVPDLSSWSVFVEPMLAHFATDKSMNLIVAPHIKMFRRKSARLREAWNGRSTDNVLIDTGSERLLDNTYTAAADVYVGDVSSQVYEFTAEPRPCVFLNPQDLDWRENPHFRFWEMGEVVEYPAKLSAALQRAADRHPEFRDRQIELTQMALGINGPEAARRSADLILQFMANGRVEQ